jgi:fumarate reductase subunit C
MFFVASILLGAEAFNRVAGMMEGSLFFERTYPVIVTLVAMGVFALFVLHALLALRKFPASYRQYQTFHGHMKRMGHEDTTLWFVQVFTGFAMFFLGSVHLYIMMTRPDTIGAYGSANRVVSEWMWPLYLLLLLAVELHGSIGLYRLAVKWGFFSGRNVVESRRKLKRAKWVITVFFLTLGLASLAAFIKIGITQADHYGQPVTPPEHSMMPVQPVGVVS